MSSRALVVDTAVAVAIVALVLIISPGLAIAGILALLVMLVCGATLLFERRRRPPQRR